MSDLPETRPSCTSNQLLSAATSGLLSAWRMSRCAAASRWRGVLRRPWRCRRSAGAVRPAEGECRPAAFPLGIGHLLVDGVAVALDDAGVAGERLQSDRGAAPGRVGVDDAGRIA